MKASKAPAAPDIAGSVLALPAWKRLLIALGVLVLLWIAIAWAVAIR